MLGIAGAIAATETDQADFLVVVPFNMTLRRMKVSVAAAVAGAMVVQLRRSTTVNPQTYSNVTGFSVTFSSGQFVQTVDPTDVDVNEGDVLNVSCTTGSGSNLLVAAIGVVR